MKTRRNELWPLAGGLVALLVAIQIPAGLAQPPSEQDLWKACTRADWLPKESAEKHFVEVWYVVLRSANGDSTFLSFARGNVAVESSRAGIALRHIPAEGQVVSGSWRHLGQDVKVDADGRMAFGSSSLSLSGRNAKVRIREGRTKLDLSLKGWADGVKLGDGRHHPTKDKGQWFERFFHVPGGEASWTLNVEGKETALTGTGWIHHTRQNVLWSDYLGLGLSMWAVGSDASLLFTAYWPRSAMDEDSHGRLPRSPSPAARLLVVDREGNLWTHAQPDVRRGKYLRRSEHGNLPGFRLTTESKGSEKGRDDLVIKVAPVRVRGETDQQPLTARLPWLDPQAADLVAGGFSIVRAMPTSFKAGMRRPKQHRFRRASLEFVVVPPVPGRDPQKPK